MVYDFYVTSSPFTKVPVTFEGVFLSSFTRAPNSYPAPGNAYLQTLFGIGSKNADDDRSEFQTTFGFFLPYDPDAPQFTPSTVGEVAYSVNHTGSMKVFGTFKGTTLVSTNADGHGAGTVNMVAQGTIWMSEGKSLGGRSFVDPHLEIAPDFLAANPGSTLTITAGVGNQVASIPEPSTYSLMFVGLGSLVMAARRRAKAYSERHTRDFGVLLLR